MAGRDGEAMLAVLRELRGELGDERPPAGIPRPAAADADGLVASLRAELARLAEAANSGPASVVQVALDGAELVMRRELELGGEAEIAAHLPSFAFLVVLPGLGRERAVALSVRAEELLG